MNTQHVHERLEELTKVKAKQHKASLEQGDNWSDHQWEAYHFNQARLQDNIAFLEEKLESL